MAKTPSIVIGELRKPTTFERSVSINNENRSLLEKRKSELMKEIERLDLEIKNLPSRIGISRGRLRKLNHPILEQEKSRRKKLTSELNRIIDASNKSDSKIKREIRALVESHISLLHSLLPYEEERSMIRKGEYGSFFGGWKTYSLWVGDNPVVLYSGGTEGTVVATRRRDSSLEEMSVDLNPVFSKEVVDRLTLLEYAPGDYILPKGFVLTKKQREVAEDVFEQVRTGKIILPSPEHPQGYVVRKQRNHIGEEESLDPRIWGQDYLNEKEPDRKFRGRLLGSGGSYVAFIFGDTVVVEFDLEGRATYLFEKSYFDSLGVWERGKILSENPEGFKGRVIHKETQTSWQRKVDHFLDR